MISGTNDIRIDCDSLYLREHQEEDLFAMHSILSNPAVMRYAAVLRSENLTDTQMHLNWMIGEAQKQNRVNYYLAACQSKGAYVGIGGIGITQHNRNGGIAEIGYYLKEKYWNRGYATQIADSLIAYGFKHLGVHKVYASCSVNNMASVKVLQKCNMQLESVIRADRYEAGAWVDTLSFSILKNEWLQTL